MNKKADYHHIYETCKDHMHAYVLVETVDGTKMDGIVTGLDEENVYLAVPVNNEENYRTLQNEETNRQFGQGYGGYPSYGQNYGYGYNQGYGHNYGYGHRPRRFNRLVLPLAALAALSILPWY